METPPAFLAGILGINFDYRQSSTLCLVGDALPQVVEGPVVEASALLASGLNPVSDTPQGFQGNAPTVALRHVDDQFGDTVILVFLKPGLFTADVAEFARGRSRALALKIASAVGIRAPGSVDLPPAVAVPFAIDCQVDDAQVNTKYARDAGLFRVRDVTDACDVPLPLDVHQVHFPFAKSEQCSLPLPTLVRDGQASFQGPDGNRTVGAEAEDAVIVGLRGMRAEPAPGLAVQLIGVSNLGDTPDSHLRRQPKPLTTGTIGERMQFELSKRLVGPCLTREPRAGSVGSLKRLEQGRMLLGSRSELDVSDQFHSSSIEDLSVRSKGKAVALRRNFRFLSLF